MTIPLRVLAVTCLLPIQAAAAQSLTSREGEPAQKTRREEPVPKQYLPPRGMCRIWVDNVPPARQPAPTDCATAIRNRPPNARVIFPAGQTGAPKATGAGKARTDTAKRKPPN